MANVLKTRSTYLDNLIKFKDKDVIKVVTGIRRCGKSSLLQLFADYLKNNGVNSENIVQINFENLKFGKMTYMELHDYIKEISDKTNGKLYIFLDEIQKIKSWELAINSLRVGIDCDIYITGSNAYLLSSQLSTYLSGRYVEIKVRPLSFKEFLSFYNFDDKLTIDDKFNLFLRYGGMPGITNLNFDHELINQMLEGIYTTVIVKDVIEQSEVRDPVLLRKIARFLADNVGNTTSINNIKNVLIANENVDKRTNVATVDNYIMLLENAFIFYPINRYDIKGKEYLKTQGKYYIVDIGLRNQILGYRDIDFGHVIENVVYLELLNRGYNVSIGKFDNKEIDFIATKFDEKVYFQVTKTMMSDETRERELTPLKSIKDNYEKVILTMDTIFTDVSDDGIKIKNLVKWLTE